MIRKILFTFVPLALLVAAPMDAKTKTTTIKPGHPSKYSAKRHTKVHRAKVKPMKAKLKH